MKRLCSFWSSDRESQAPLNRTHHASYTSTGDSNTTEKRRKHKPRRMGYRHVITAAKTSIQAFEHDPLHTYMRETPDYKGTWAQKASANVRFRLTWSTFVHKRRAWTIDGGKACIGYSELYKNERQTPIDKVFDFTISRLLRLQSKFLTKEQLKRRLEVKEKLETAINEAIGARKAEMHCLEIIATSPEKQGRGYGSALAKLVTDVADAECRDSWLVSCNVAANTVFYNSLGYETVAMFVVGEDNTTWKGAPVVIAIMIRKYTPPSDSNEK